MKKFLQLPRKVAQRYASAPVIAKIDGESDRTADVLGSGIRGGFLRSKIDEVLESPGMTETLKSSELRRLPSDGKRVLIDWNVPAFVWEAILGSSTLRNMVQKYIGPNVRLDDLYLKNVLDGLSVGSGGWHDDNVGYRLKVFMVFDTEGTPSGTVIIPHDRPRIYQVNLRDELKRFTASTTQEERNGEVHVDYEPGDCLVFDTNIPHRGDYSGGTGVRYCLIAEFIDRNKANLIRKSAPCGPGQGNRRIQIPELNIDPSDHPLMDAALLEKTQSGWDYGYK